MTETAPDEPCEDAVRAPVSGDHARAAPPPATLTPVRASAPIPALPALPGHLADLDPTLVAVLLGVALLVLWRLARRRQHRTPTRRARRRPSTRRPTSARPRVGDVWWADVPFEDGGGSKDRPCVVVDTHDLRSVVLYVTSTDKAGRPGWLAMPRQGWSPRPGTSWLRTDRRVALDPHRMRRYAGPCPPPVRTALGI